MALPDTSLHMGRGAKTFSQAHVLFLSSRRELLSWSLILSVNMYVT